METIYKVLSTPEHIYCGNVTMAMEGKVAGPALHFISCPFTAANKIWDIYIYSRLSLSQSQKDF